MTGYRGFWDNPCLGPSAMEGRQMTDYSMWRRCQWIVTHRQMTLWPGEPRAENVRGLCRKRARHLRGNWTWLCAQHSRAGAHLLTDELVTKISTVAGRPSGEL
jgi:hypothetical protein